MHWNGAAWQPVAAPEGASGTGALYAVTALAPDDVWAVGFEATSDGDTNALTIHWDGDAWNVDSIKLAGAWAVPRHGRVRRHRVSRIPPEEDRRSRAQGMRYLWALPSLACWPSID